jgi:hypothetical protein
MDPIKIDDSLEHDEEIKTELVIKTSGQDFVPQTIGWKGADWTEISTRPFKEGDDILRGHSTKYEEDIRYYDDVKSFLDPTFVAIQDRFLHHYLWADYSLLMPDKFPHNPWTREPRPTEAMELYKSPLSIASVDILRWQFFKALSSFDEQLGLVRFDIARNATDIALGTQDKAQRSVTWPSTVIKPLNDFVSYAVAPFSGAIAIADDNWGWRSGDFQRPEWQALPKIFSNPSNLGAIAVDIFEDCQDVTVGVGQNFGAVFDNQSAFVSHYTNPNWMNFIVPPVLKANEDSYAAYHQKIAQEILMKIGPTFNANAPTDAGTQFDSTKTQPLITTLAAAGGDFTALAHHFASLVTKYPVTPKHVSAATINGVMALIGSRINHALIPENVDPTLDVEMTHATLWARHWFMVGRGAASAAPYVNEFGYGWNGAPVWPGWGGNYLNNPRKLLIMQNGNVYVKPWNQYVVILRDIIDAIKADLRQNPVRNRLTPRQIEDGCETMYLTMTAGGYTLLSRCCAVTNQFLGTAWNMPDLNCANRVFPREETLTSLTDVTTNFVRQQPNHSTWQRMGARGVDLTYPTPAQTAQQIVHPPAFSGVASTFGQFAGLFYNGSTDNPMYYSSADQLTPYLEGVEYTMGLARALTLQSAAKDTFVELQAQLPVGARQVAPNNTMVVPSQIPAFSLTFSEKTALLSQWVPDCRYLTASELQSALERRGCRAYFFTMAGPYHLEARIDLSHHPYTIVFADAPTPFDSSYIIERRTDHYTPMVDKPTHIPAAVVARYVANRLPVTMYHNDLGVSTHVVSIAQLQEVFQTLVNSSAHVFYPKVRGLVGPRVTGDIIGNL